MQLSIIILLILAFLILITKNNFLMFFIALELFVLAINLNFILFSISLENGLGLYIAVILLALAAVDTTIGLSLLMGYFNLQADTRLSSMRFLKG